MLPKGKCWKKPKYDEFQMIVFLVFLCFDLDLLVASMLVECQVHLVDVAVVVTSKKKKNV